MLKVQLQWIYSEVKFCRLTISELEDSIQILQQQCSNIKRHLDSFRAPFKILLDEINFFQSDDDSEEIALIKTMGDSRWKAFYDTELEIVNKLDPTIESIAEKLGFDPVTELQDCLLKFLQIAVGIYLILSVFSCLTRPDFVNLVVASVTTLMLVNSRVAKRRYFRYLTLIILGSLVYDLVWIFGEWRTPETSVEPKTMSRMEMDIVKICSYISLFSVLLRIFLIFLFWRVSVDFNAIVR